MSPEEELLILIHDAIADAQPWTEAGLGTFTWRHYRHRPLGEHEIDGLCLEFISTGPQRGDAEDGYGVAGELRKEMVCNLRGRFNLPPEDDGTDPTGVKVPTLVIAEIMHVLKRDEQEGIGLYANGVWAIATGETTIDDDSSTAEQVALDSGFTVVYRVLEADQKVLLKG